MLQDLKRGLLFTVVAMILFGFGYHALLWTIGRIAFPDQAEGSLVRRANGGIAGSRLIAQRFERPEYFHPRPSGVGYNAASTGGTNYGPSNSEHLKAARERLDAIISREGVPASRVPSEMMTASGGGLDPHIPPEAAEIQILRVARARLIAESHVRALVRQHTEGPTFGFLGRARINVLQLNLALDRGSRSGINPGSTQ
jgi:potassium-transporting ATPase KdpC subunit